MHIVFWWESQKGRDHYEDLCVGGRVILKWIVEIQDDVIWTGFIWLKKGTSRGLL
jgi:hypothetical protein